jgi:hypothetical protein
MTKEEKIIYLIEKGYTYNPETGKVISHKNHIINTNHIDGYKVISFKIKNKSHRVLQHQFAWYYMYKELVDVIDHINGVKDDNRISNLRNITFQKNLFNSKSKGCYFNKRTNKWHSQIMLDYKKIHLGFFDTEEEARTSYLNAKQKYHII